MRRRAADHDAPPAVRGAALGFLWSTRAEVDEAAAAHAVRGAARPETLGDFLTGLFALAREEVLHSTSLLGVVDDVVTPMVRDDFLVAIPSLRLAFSYFPPREKEQIARKVLAVHGDGGEDAALPHQARGPSWRDDGRDEDRRRRRAAGAPLRPPGRPR